MPRWERITLVGGPGDGSVYEWQGGDTLKWKPTDAREQVMVRMNDRELSDADPVIYVRSRRSRHLFVYQP